MIYITKKDERNAKENGAALYEEGMARVAALDFEGAVAPLREAAETGHTEAMAEVGYLLAHGLGVAADAEEALSYLRKSADAGCDYACYVLWEMHDDGFSAVSAVEAKQRCEEAAARGYGRAVARLADGFDTRPVTEILTEQADKGSADALWYLYLEYNGMGDEEMAARYLCKALDAEQVDALLCMADACAEVANGELYDPADAENYYRRAAARGSERACLALARMALGDDPFSFWEQAGSDRSPSAETRARHEKQYAWLLAAAKLGRVDAMTKVAIAYHYGYPCEKNGEEAFLWASRAADAEDTYAAYQVGYFYENAVGREKDMDAALLFYTKAAEAGVFEAMLRLADIYGNGKDGVAKDLAKANRYRFLSGVGRD